MEKIPVTYIWCSGPAAGILAFWLPETLTADMPQTVEQAEAWDELQPLLLQRVSDPGSTRS